jgi:hypothetical protein
VVDPIAAAGCVIWQHGWGHHFYDNGEFGEGRPLDRMIEDAQRGWQQLDRVLGPQNWQRVFVPPNHQLAMSFKSMIPGLGYLGVSAGLPLTPPLNGVTEVNAEVDVMDWPKGRILPLSAVADAIADALRARRQRQVPSDTPLGLLTHHLAFDEAAWDWGADDPGRAGRASGRHISCERVRCFPRLSRHRDSRNRGHP